MVKYPLGMLAVALTVGIAGALVLDRMPVGSVWRLLGAWFGISALIAIVSWPLGRAEKHKQQ